MNNAYIDHVELDENNIIHISAHGNEDVFRKNVTQIVLQNDLWVELFNIETADLESLFMKLVGEGEEDQRVKKQKQSHFLRRFVK